jgi:hypothetical protein
MIYNYTFSLRVQLVYLYIHNVFFYMSQANQFNDEIINPLRTKTDYPTKGLTKGGDIS